MNVRRIVRLLLFNAVLVVAVWMGLVLATAVVGDVYNFVKNNIKRGDDRSEMPNYADKQYARDVFADIKKTIEDYQPYLAWRRKAMTTQYVNINEHGFRQHTEGPENNEAGARTIGFFGGSTMWGTGVDDNGTIPAAFDQLTTDFEVTNYGEGGHNTRQMLALLINLIDTGQMPEVVVFYDGVNHIWTHCNYAVTRSLNGHMVERKLRRALTENPRFGFTFQDVVLPPLEFVRRIVGEKKFVENEYACHDDPVRAAQVADTLVRIWDIAAVLVRHYGGEFYAFLQPVAYIGSARVDHLKFTRIHGAEQFRTVYPYVNAAIDERGLDWFADISDAFDGTDEYIYIDRAHVTRNGNEIIARRMLEAMTDGAAR